MCDVLPSYNPYDGADDFEGSNNNTEDFDSGFSGQRVNASAAAGGDYGTLDGHTPTSQGGSGSRYATLPSSEVAPPSVVPAPVAAPAPGVATSNNYSSLPASGFAPASAPVATPGNARASTASSHYSSLPAAAVSPSTPVASGAGGGSPAAQGGVYSSLPAASSFAPARDGRPTPASAPQPRSPYSTLPSGSVASTGKASGGSMYGAIPVSAFAESKNTYSELPSSAVASAPPAVPAGGNYSSVPESFFGPPKDAVGAGAAPGSNYGVVPESFFAASSGAAAPSGSPSNYGTVPETCFTHQGGSSPAAAAPASSNYGTVPDSFFAPPSAASSVSAGGNSGAATAGPNNYGTVPESFFATAGVGQGQAAGSAASAPPTAGSMYSTVPEAFLAEAKTASPYSSIPASAIAQQGGMGAAGVASGAGPAAAYGTVPEEFFSPTSLPSRNESGGNNNDGDVSSSNNNDNNDGEEEGGKRSGPSDGRAGGVPSSPPGTGAVLCDACMCAGHVTGVGVLSAVESAAAVAARLGVDTTAYNVTEDFQSKLNFGMCARRATTWWVHGRLMGCAYQRLMM